MKAQQCAKDKCCSASTPYKYQAAVNSAKAAVETAKAAVNTQELTVNNKRELNKKKHHQ